MAAYCLLLNLLSRGVTVINIFTGTPAVGLDG